MTSGRIRIEGEVHTFGQRGRGDRNRADFAVDHLDHQASKTLRHLPVARRYATIQQEDLERIGPAIVDARFPRLVEASAKAARPQVERKRMAACQSARSSASLYQRIVCSGS